MKAAIIGVAGPVLAGEEIALIRDHRPAGVILFARNVVDPDQLRALTGHLSRLLPPLAVLMIDQEGGRVARLRPPHWRAHPPAAAIGALYAADAPAGLRAAWLTGALIGLEAGAAGIEVVCAPVLDRAVPGATAAIGDRAFAADPDAVGELGAAFAAGLLAAGVQPVGKHAPGHGRAAADSHLELPRLDAIIYDDLVPFSRCAHLPWMMTAHIVYAAQDAHHPATLSPTIIADTIRGDLGFTGVLVSDDLAMHALTGAPGERADAALAAGCDLALHCSGVLADSAEVLADCPAPTEAALQRLRGAVFLADRSRQRLDAAALCRRTPGPAAMIGVVATVAVEIAAAIAAITLHEAAHGYAARALGDDTASLAGRLSLNPLRHVDRVGTILLPGFLLISQLLTIGRVAFMFGWAKPVPVNAWRFKYPRQGMALVAAAGPAMNFLLAWLAALSLYATDAMTGVAGDLAGNFVDAFIVTNLVLGLFNLLPIPPLDGGRIVVGLLPAGLAMRWAKLERAGHPAGAARRVPAAADPARIRHRLRSGRARAEPGAALGRRPGAAGGRAWLNRRCWRRTRLIAAGWRCNSMGSRGRSTCCWSWPGRRSSISPASRSWRWSSNISPSWTAPAGCGWRWRPTGW